MGTAYERWLIPKGTVFSPSAAAIAKLVARLRKEKWIVDPASGDLAALSFDGDAKAMIAAKTGGYAVKTVGDKHGKTLREKLAACVEPQPASLTSDWLDTPERDELRLVWPVSARSLPLKYPLSRRPDGEVYYALEVHRAPDYVYPIAETIDAVPTECPCGEDLSFDWDESILPAFGAATGIYTECEECSRTFDPSKKSATITNPFDGSEQQIAGGAAYRFALRIDCGKCFVADPKIAFAEELVALVQDEFGRAFVEFGATH
jgi:hypothetical protein